MISILVTILVMCLVFGLIWWILTLIPLSDSEKVVAAFRVLWQERWFPNPWGRNCLKS